MLSDADRFDRWFFFDDAVSPDREEVVIQPGIVISEPLNFYRANLKMPAGTDEFGVKLTKTVKAMRVQFQSDMEKFKTVSCEAVWLDGEPVFKILEYLAEWRRVHLTEPTRIPNLVKSDVKKFCERVGYPWERGEAIVYPELS